MGNPCRISRCAHILHAGVNGLTLLSYLALPLKPARQQY